MKYLRPLANASVWKSPTVIVLVLANLIPIYGVIFHGWEVFPILFLFWFENVVIGILNVVKLMLAGIGSDGLPQVVKFFMVPFFAVHYGIFTMVHGMFVIGFFGREFKPGGSPFPTGDLLQRLITEQHLGWAVLGLGLSHLFSFAWNYLLRGEYRTAQLPALMFAPYGRVVVLHLTIIGGGFLMMAMGSPVAGLVLLVVLKILFDLRSHVREHALSPDLRALPG